MTQLEMDTLEKAIRELRDKVERIRGADRGIGEQNTKAALIDPLLSALGWDVHEPDEVMREFKAHSRDKPVDYALQILRKPVLLIEAKALGENLSDRNWYSQVISCAAVAGVPWCVLTNGDSYHFYNAGAPLDARDKCFGQFSLTTSEVGESATMLTLIARRNLEENEIASFWNAHYVDRLVSTTLKAMLESADRRLIRAIRGQMSGLSAKEIGDSLRRFDFFIRPAAIMSDSRTLLKKSAGDTRQPPLRKKGPTPNMLGVVPKDLIAAGILQPPLTLTLTYNGTEERATLLATGQVEFDGKRYSSVSGAAGAAKSKILGAKARANGWRFWSFTDNSGKTRKLIEARREYLQNRGSA
jgi:hypothetical protein